MFKITIHVKEVKEHFHHDDCPKCGTMSVPFEGVPDQALRSCPKCEHQWVENLDEPVLSS
jgi:hypothetical protein